jgi:hypothetical protein
LPIHDTEFFRAGTFMTDPLTVTPLLAVLRGLPTGSLYTLGDKKELVKALILCQQKSVRMPQWAEGRDILSVEVFGSQPHEVILSLQQDRLTLRCDCQWEPSARPCRHQLAALFTLKKALDPAAVSGLREDAGDLHAIRTALLEEEPIQRLGRQAQKKLTKRKGTDSFAVVLEERYGILFVEVTRNGLPVHPFEEIPAPLRPLVTTPYSYGPRPATVLCALLDQGTCPCPIVARVDGEMVPLSIAPPIDQSGQLRLSAGIDGVLVSRVIADGTLQGARL